MAERSVGTWLEAPTSIDWSGWWSSGLSNLPVIVVCVLAALGVYHLIDRARRIARQSRYKATTVTDPANQLRYVMRATFTKTKLMNGAEFRVFKVAEEQVQAHRRGYRVMSQTNLGEIITTPDRRAFESINSKRVDILVISPSGHAVAAIECQGAGHYQRDDTAARDAVKREALRRAGVEYVEIFERHSVGEIAQIVREVLSRAEGRNLEQQRAARPPWGG